MEVGGSDVEKCGHRKRWIHASDALEEASGQGSGRLAAIRRGAVKRCRAELSRRCKGLHGEIEVGSPDLQRRSAGWRCRGRSELDQSPLELGACALIEACIGTASARPAHLLRIDQLRHKAADGLGHLRAQLAWPQCIE